MTRKPNPFDTPYAVGARVRHRRSGVEGTVVGAAVPARSAGSVPMQRVVWDGPFRQHPDGKATFVRDVEAIR